MDFISILFLAIGGLLSLGSLSSLIMALSKKWNSAFKISPAMSLGTAGLYVAVIIYVILNIAVLAEDPSSRAASLARGIALAMNLSVYVLPAVIVSGIIWPISSKRKTKSSRETEIG
jgi:hypothetical protein